MRIIGIDVPGFGVPTHAEAKDVLAGAMLRYARGRRPSRARCSARAGRRPSEPGRHADRRAVPGRPGRRRRPCSQPMGLAVAPQLPSREWRDLYAALDCVAAAAVHPFYTATVREFHAAGRPVVGSGPVGVEGTAAWLEAIGKAAGVPAGKIDAAKAAALPAIRAALGGQPDQGPRHRLRLRGLGAAGGPAADRGRRGGALCRHRLPAHRVERSRPRVARGQGHARPVPRLARAGHRGDARREARPGARHHARWCRRPRSWASRRSTSPTWSPPGRCSGRPAPARWPGSSPPRPRAASASRAWSSSSAASARATPPATAGPACRPTIRRPRRATGKARVRGRPRRRGGGLSHAGPRPRPCRRLLGCRLRLHRDQGPAGRHRRAGGLREPAGDGGPALHRRAAAARAAGRRHRACPKTSSR